MTKQVLGDVENGKAVKEIEKYKKDNPKKTVKEIVKYFNNKYGERTNEVKLSFTSTVYASVYDEWNRLTTSEQLLIVSDPVAAGLTYMTKDLAYSLLRIIWVGMV